MYIYIYILHSLAPCDVWCYTPGHATQPPSPPLPPLCHMQLHNYDLKFEYI